MGLETALIASVIGTTAAGIATSVDSARRQKNQAKDAARAAEQQAKEASRQAEMETNRSNQRRADSSAATPGLSLGSTMLTGPQGVAGNQLHLGKSTLLGQ